MQAGQQRAQSLANNPGSPTLALCITSLLADLCLDEWGNLAQRSLCI